MNNSQLSELEDDIQQQLAATEQRVRDEASTESSHLLDALAGYT